MLTNHRLGRFAAGLPKRLARAGRPNRRRAISGPSLRLELLEPRQLLSANPIINEFLARNDAGLRDGNGRSSDWIEIYNAGDEAVDLAGYRLTDDASNLAQWVFPSTQLDAGDYLVVFASGQSDPNYVDTDGYLHTNFTLTRGGDYLALVSPEGTVVSEYGSSGANYPEQLANVSYGRAQSLTLVTPESDAAYLVPLDDSLGMRWTKPDFDAPANGFTAGTAAIGLESKPESRGSFTDQFDTTLPDETHAVFARMEFSLGDASAISDLLLRLKYDNGFVAYLNGIQVAQENAPANLGWFATATNTTRRDSEALEWAEFDLSDHVDALVDGKNVLALHGLNHFQDSGDMLLVAQLDAGASDLAAATGTPAKVGYISTPTPGGPNAGNDKIYAGFVADTRFSADRGFYDQPFQVEITTDTAGAVIRYTTDGSTPTADHGDVYSGPITITTTTPLRAAAFKEDFLPTNVDTETYIFIKDVINQGNSPPGYPSQWGLGIGPVLPADYEMDPEITQNPAYRDIMDDALLQVPTLSIVTDIDNLFDPETGIYQNAMNSGVEWERPASVELIYPDGTKGFQEDAGLRIQGGASRLSSKSPKHSLRLLFKSEYGASKLKFPWFAEDTAVDEFDTIVLRAGFNQSYIHHNTFRGDNRGRAQYIRDQWAKDTQLAMGYPAPHNTYAHLYINGMYWGLYNPSERPTDGFAASYFGGEKDEYDVYNSGELLDGTPDAWNKLFDEIKDDLADDAEYQDVANILDIDAYIDYMIINQYGGNMDWDDHNWYATRRRTDDGKWQFYMWDSEFLFIGVNDTPDAPDGNQYPASLLQRRRDGAGLIANAEFRMKYADHIQRHFFNDGLLTPQSSIDRWEARSGQISDAIVAESARWGDYRRDVDNMSFPAGTPFELLERDVQWVRERNRLLNDYFPQRTAIVLEQYRKDGLYPDVDAPRLNQHGGLVSSDFGVRLTADEGTIYYTTDGSDPRLPGGAVSPNAMVFADPLSIAGDTTIKARVLLDDEWSALTEADFSLGSEFPLRITEINYDPLDANAMPGVTEVDVDNDRFEFVEVMNVASEPVNLEGVQLQRSTVGGDEQGIAFTFAAQELGPGERLVVVRDREAFQSRYGTGIRIAAGNDGQEGNEGEYGGRLANNGEQLSLADPAGKLIQQFRYRTAGDWPARAKGAGSSLEIVDPTGGVTNAANWRASLDFGGSPGTAGATSSAISINEILANTASPGVDRIELLNRTADDVNVQNWYISDAPGDYFKSKITAPKIVPASGYQVLTGSEIGLDLDGIAGGHVLLVSADAGGRPLQFVDQVQFGLAGRDVSLGPWPTSSDPLVPLDEPTFGGPNAGPRIGDVIITEIHYNAIDVDDAGPARARDLEYIELYNRTDEAIDLGGWRLRGVTFTFDAGTVIQPQSTLLVMPYDPSRGTSAIVFRFFFGIDPSIPLVGRYRGTLGDDSGLVQLQRPIAPADDPAATVYLTVDEVPYEDKPPWPAGADGTGKSLTRVTASQFGRLPSSWVAQDPSPGTVAFVQRVAGDANEDGQFDQKDIVAVLQAGKFMTGQPATWSEGDWTSDGQFNQLDIVAALQSGRYMQAAVDRAIIEL